MYEARYELHHYHCIWLANSHSYHLCPSSKKIIDQKQCFGLYNLARRIAFATATYILVSLKCRV